MSVIEKECPHCGGNIHAESFIGHTGNTNAYTERICIGEKGTEGQDGSFWVNRAGCGFRARKDWDSENKAETESANGDWAEWKQYHG